MKTEIQCTKEFVLPHKSGLLFYSVRYQNFLLCLGKTCLTNQHQLSLGRPENTNILDEHPISNLIFRPTAMSPLATTLLYE